MTNALVPLSTPPEWAGMTGARREIIARGEEALHSFRQGLLPRILAIGAAFEELQLEAMDRSHSANPIGKRYNDAYALLEKPTPELAKINKTDRNQYVWCWQQRDALTRWWEAKAQNERDRWGHPDSIKKRYLADTTIKDPGDPLAEKPPTPMQKARAEIVRLQEEADAKDRKIRLMERGADNVTEGRDWTWQDDPKDIAAAWFRVQPTKSVRAASALLQLAKATTQKPTRTRKRRETQPLAERGWDDEELRPA